MTIVYHPNFVQVQKTRSARCPLAPELCSQAFSTMPWTSLAMRHFRQRITYVVISYGMCSSASQETYGVTSERPSTWHVKSIPSSKTPCVEMASDSSLFLRCLLAEADYGLQCTVRFCRST